MMSAPPQKKSAKPEIPSDPPASSMDMADAGNMDKIRDILFGHQARDYEKRFSGLENQLTQEAAELKTELIKRIDSLETYVKQELRDINDRINSESSTRTDADTRLTQDLKDAVETLTKKLAKEEENLVKKSTELRDQILDQSKQLSAEISARYDQNSTNLKKAAHDLDETKVNRSDLSGFFLELAMRLSGDDGLKADGPKAG